MDDVLRIARSENPPSPERMREIAYSAVSKMTAAEAETSLHALASCTEDPRINNVLLLVGNLADRLEDAIALSEEEREKKLRLIQIETSEKAILHRFRAKSDAESSARRIANREFNSTILKSERELGRSRIRGLDEENFVWMLTDDRLLPKDPMFWYKIPLDSLSDRDKRLTLAAVEDFVGRNGKTHIPRSVLIRFDDEMNRLPYPETHVTTRRYRPTDVDAVELSSHPNGSFVLRLVKRLVRSIRKRRTRAREP